jgi:hypothetical protein
MFNAIMPITSKTVKCHSNIYKPWITSAIRKSIRRKHSLYKSYLKNKCPILHKNINFIRIKSPILYELQRETTTMKNLIGLKIIFLKLGRQ